MDVEQCDWFECFNDCARTTESWNKTVICHSYLFLLTILTQKPVVQKQIARCDSVRFKYEAQTALFKDPVRTAQ